MGNRSNLWNVFFLLSTLINNKRSKDEIKKIHRENLANRGIVEYMTCPIEAFISESEQILNMVVSGGNNDYRSRACVRAIECAWAHNYSVVVLHCSNHIFEQKMIQVFGKNNVLVVNPNNPIYDPFYGRSKAEISDMILGSTTKGYEIQPTGKYYIDGISDFIQAKKINPYIKMYIKCPHDFLLDRVNNDLQTGVISSHMASLITTQIMQGELERGNIEHFFQGLANQCQLILASKASLNKATNIKLAINHNKIIMIDVLSDTHNLLINMLSNEVKNLLSQGKKIFLVIDNIHMLSSPVLQSIEKQSGLNMNLLISSNDVYSSFGGDDNHFYSFMGGTSKVLILKHTSAYSCQKWSDIIGTFDKQEINQSYTRNLSFFGPGSSKSYNVNLKREPIVKPDEIQRMREDEIFVISKSKGELGHAIIT